MNKATARPLRSLLFVPGDERPGWRRPWRRAPTR